MSNRLNIIRDSDSLVLEEQKKLGEWRRSRCRENQPWTGIALSGGGIRSATFCLGVLQALANKDHLKHFDYISTVSGGGYTGCALQWWWHHGPTRHEDKTFSHPEGFESGLGTSKDNFPFGTSEPGPAPSERDDAYKRARLKRLRDHANYLAPGGGINYYSGLGAGLRAMLLNLLVWIPVIGLLFFAAAASDQVKPVWFSAMDYVLSFEPPHASFLFKAVLLAVAALISVFILFSIFYSLVSTHEEGEIYKYSIEYLLIAAILIIFLIYMFNFDNYSAFSKSEPLPSAFFVLVIILAAVFMWKALSKWLSIGLPTGIGEAYQYRRWLDRGFGWFFPFFILLLAFSVLPFVYEYVFKAGISKSSKPSVSDFLFGLLAVGAGTTASLWGYYQLFRNFAPKLATSVFLPVGGALFLLGVAVLGYFFGVNFYRVLHNGISFTEVDIKYLLLFLSFIVLGISILSAFMVNINQISLNRFYRDRLMEAFMPRKDFIVSDSRLSPAWTEERSASPADILRLRDLSPKTGATSKHPHDYTNPGPYPLINTNVVLVNDPKPKFRLRGGDNFVLTPHFCGSEATGWAKTKEAFPNISLATCMAASAAAVNPFTGYVGTGPTRNRIVSIVLALLNLRLGVWVRNPRKTASYITYRQPDHIFPGLWYALPGRGHRHNSYFLELTDGGHFDNLGLYELVRRRCKVILVCDGEMDRTTSYAALVSLQRRIKDDFDAHIIFESQQGPELLVESASMDYPSGALMAKRTFFTAKIAYADGSIGHVIYIKARMIEELSFQVKAYKGAHMDFPHESTGDQFFDPEQFDAHLELGYRACICADDSINTILAQATEHVTRTSY